MKGKIFKKSIITLGISSLMTTAMIGCGSQPTVDNSIETKESSNKKESTEAKESIDKDSTTTNSVEKGKKEFDGREITVMVTQSHNVDGLQNMFKKLETDEGIKADVQVIPDEQYLNMVQMKRATGELPDLVEYNIPHLYTTLIPEEDILDLTDQEWTKRLKDPSIVQVDSKIYAFPLRETNGYQALIYNKDVFDKNGLSIPTTKEEFDQLCETLKSKGVTPILVASDTWVPQIWMTAGYARAMGSEEAASEMCDKIFSGKAVLNDYPQLAQVIDEVLALNDKGYMNDDLTSLSWDDAWSNLSQGKGAMLMGEASMICSQQPNYPDTHFGVFNYPAAFDSKDLLSAARFSTGFVANNKTPNQDVIEKVFNCFSTPEYEDLFFANGNAGFPAFEGVNGGELQEDIVQLFESHVADKKLVSEMNLHWNRIDPLIGAYLWNYYGEALAKHNMNGKEILDKFQEDINKYMKENKVDGF